MNNFANKTAFTKFSYLLVLAAAFAGGLYLMFKFEPTPTRATDIGRIELPPTSNGKPAVRKQFKILHVMSYHSPWEWTDTQFDGFQAALNELNIQYYVMQMDAKRKSGEVWRQQIANEICNAIDTAKPDLLFAGDDVAQEYVAKKYVNSSMPIVFCAVNENPEVYGFKGSSNVTGVIEKIHFVATVQLLKELVPGVRRVAVLCDTGAMWASIIEDMKQNEGRLPGVQVVSYDVLPTFEEFKQKVTAYQKQVDALGFLGIFEFKDQQGKNVPMENVLKWLQDNSKLPDFSFWADRVDKGTLCSVSISGYEQGYQAGLYARQILVEGKSPSAIPMLPTEKGIPMLNLATAKRLNINPNAELLLSSRVFRDIALK
jgi:ABC-type uncharacterized transport system substrate-binding protein